MLISLKPRSFFGVTATGFLLVSVPLVVAALLAAFYARQIATQTGQMVGGGIRVVQQGRALEDTLVGLERTVRQYQVVQDAALLDRVGERHVALRAALAGLADPPPAVDAAALARIRADAAAVAGALGAGGSDDAAFAGAYERLARMRATAAGIREQARRSIDGEAQAIQRVALRAQRTLLIYCLLLVPLIVAVALVLAIHVALPLRRLDRTIRAIGTGRLDVDVPAGGPLELRRLSRQLNWLRERLRSVEQDKNRFLRAMAHELKTPLASVREGADLLSDGALGRLSVPQQEVADILRNNSFELQTLIENLLAYEEWRNRAGRLELAVTPLRPLVEQCVQRYRLIAASKALVLDVTCDDRPVNVDQTLLRMALDNLLSNAVKFSPAGGTVTVWARVKAGPGAAAARQLEIEVADEGPGIPHGDRNRIFESLHQGAPAPGQHVHGSGIGLSVVREFVLAHHGRVELLDGQFRGAHFRISLALPAEPAQELAA